MIKMLSKVSRDGWALDPSCGIEEMGVVLNFSNTLNTSM